MKSVFLGRFQPFHKGHAKVVENYSEQHDLKIAIGSAEKEKQQENPLSFEQRKEIIKACLPDIEVIPVEDEEKNDDGNRRWAEKLDEKIDAEAVITGNQLVKRLITSYTDMKVIKPEHFGPDSYAGTEVRRRIQSGEEWRYLVPDCCKEQIKKYEEIIKKSGIDYEFEPGWEKKNAYHSTEN